MCESIQRWREIAKAKIESKLNIALDESEGETLAYFSSSMGPCEMRTLSMVIVGWSHWSTACVVVVVDRDGSFPTWVTRRAKERW